MTNKKKGILVVIDGIDGCGKTTQCKRLHEYFGEKSIITTEPTNGIIGTILRSILKGQNEKYGKNGRIMSLWTAWTSSRST